MQTKAFTCAYRKSRLLRKYPASAASQNGPMRHKVTDSGWAFRGPPQSSPRR